ncbi:PAS domain-containing protein [Streptomyces griseoviridis]|uniref:PAS domain-containing protein n=1 Tax=Streptomyces griseoviridis TaxID=45398 RepID=UPI003413C7A6
MSSRPSRGAARLAAILDALPDALVLVNANGTVVNANTIALEAFEAPGTALVGRGLLDLLPQFDSKLIPGSMRRPDHMDPRGQTKPTRMVARRTDGTEFPVEVTSANLENGQQAYDSYGYSGDELLMLVVRDLTGTVDTEAELARSQRQTEMILRAASEGVVGTDTDGRIVLVNPAAAQILGYRASDLGGKELHTLVLHSRADGGPFPYGESPLADTLRSGRKHRVRGQVVWSKSGDQVSVDLTTAPVRDGDQLVGAVMTFTDRRPYDVLAEEKEEAERRHHEDLERLDEEHASELTALRQKHVTELEELAERHAEELAAGEERIAALGEREKDRYEALAGRHEQLLTLLGRSLRGPLDELRRELAALAADDAGQLWPEANQVLHHLSAGYSRITTLIDNVLGYQLLDTGGETVSRTKVMLDAVVAAGVDGAVELIGPGRVQFAVHAPPIEAEVDPQQLATALAHLIADVAGVDATGNTPVSAGGYLDNTVVVAAAQRGEVVRIEVRGPYAGGDPVHEPIVRGIVRAHGGVLQTHEVPGMSGNAFVLEVPIGGGAGAVPVVAQEAPPAEEQTSGGGRRRARRASVDAFLESDVPGDGGEPAGEGGAPTGRRRRRAAEGAPGADAVAGPGAVPGAGAGAGAVPGAGAGVGGALPALASSAGSAPSAGLDGADEFDGFDGFDGARDSGGDGGTGRRRGRAAEGGADRGVADTGVPGVPGAPGGPGGAGVSEGAVVMAGEHAAGAAAVGTGLGGTVPPRGVPAPGGGRRALNEHGEQHALPPALPAASAPQPTPPGQPVPVDDPGQPSGRRRRALAAANERAAAQEAAPRPVFALPPAEADRTPETAARQHLPHQAQPQAPAQAQPQPPAPRQAQPMPGAVAPAPVQMPGQAQAPGLAPVQGRGQAQGPVPAQGQPPRLAPVQAQGPVPAQGLGPVPAQAPALGQPQPGPAQPQAPVPGQAPGQLPGQAHGPVPAQAQAPRPQNAGQPQLQPPPGLPQATGLPQVPGQPQATGLPPTTGQTQVSGQPQPVARPQLPGQSGQDASGDALIDDGRHDAVPLDQDDDHTPPQPHPTAAPTGRRRRAVAQPGGPAGTPAQGTAVGSEQAQPGAAQPLPPASAAPGGPAQNTSGQPLPLPAEATAAPLPPEAPAQPRPQPLPAEAAAPPAPLDPNSTQGRSISVRTLGQGVPFTRQAAQVQLPTATPPPHQPNGGGRRRKLGTPPDPAAGRPHPTGEQPAAQAQPQAQPSSQAGQSRLAQGTEGSGRSYAIGAPDVNADEGPEPLDGPGGAVEVADPPRAQPLDDELPPEPLDNPRRLLVWPAPDVTTQQALSDRGYRPVIVHSREEVDAQIAAFPAALFVDPLTGPITRTALQSLRQAAVAAEVPVMVTAGLGQATREAAYGADPAVLLKALAPRDSEQHPPRVLLIEEHAEIALALTSTLERRGMQVARAASDADAVALAGQLRPNLVVMDLMQVHRRQSGFAGIIDWLRANGQLNRTPLVVYTAAVDQADLPRLASGETVLFLAERSTSPEAQSRIVDLLARIGTN